MTNEHIPDIVQPLVSIGLGVRNGSLYIGEAINSLLGQTYQNFELIVSDNASTDTTQQICEECARRDPRIRYIRQKNDLGANGNFDFLRREAQGIYFQYAGHDDLWSRNYLERCVAQFEKNPAAVMVFSNLYAFDDTGRIIKFIPAQYFPSAHKLYDRLREYISFRNQNGKVMLLCGLWRRDILGDIVSVDGSSNDTIYVFKNLFKGYFVFNDEILFFKRTPAQFPVNPHSERPSIEFLTTLPKNGRYETPDDWHRTRKKLERKHWRTSLRTFTDRAHAVLAPFFYLECRNIFEAKALTPWEKMKLVLWEVWAYIRSIWYGHM